MAPDWPCKGQLHLFYEDLWVADDVAYSTALAHARTLCDGCHARVACLKMAMAAEGEDGLDYRAGVFAGTTPQQRHALYKRGTVWQGVDPVDLRQDIPDRGDQWTERHTKLARMTIGWLIANVDDLAEIPDALALSRKMKVGVKDLRRVYQALRDDHVIRRNPNGKLVLRNTPAAIDRWLPPHLRKALASSH